MISRVAVINDRGWQINLPTKQSHRAKKGGGGGGGVVKGDGKFFPHPHPTTLYGEDVFDCSNQTTGLNKPRNFD